MSWRRKGRKTDNINIPKRCHVTNKKVFSTKKKALSVASNHKNIQCFGSFARVYKCPHCNNWHVTTQRKRGKVNKDPSVRSD